VLSFPLVIRRCRRGPRFPPDAARGWGGPGSPPITTTFQYGVFFIDFFLFLYYNIDTAVLCGPPACTCPSETPGPWRKNQLRKSPNNYPLRCSPVKREVFLQYLLSVLRKRLTSPTGWIFPDVPGDAADLGRRFGVALGRFFIL
jgi:hypothetical protein